MPQRIGYCVPLMLILGVSSDMGNPFDDERLGVSVIGPADFRQSGFWSKLPSWLLLSRPLMWLSGVGGRIEAAQMDLLWPQIMRDAEAMTTRAISQDPP